MAASAERWLEAHYGLLLQATRSVLDNAQDAEDAAQEAALKIVRKWDTFRYGGEEKRSAWCYTVAKRVAIDLHRKNRRRYVESLAGQAITDEWVDPAANPEDLIITREELDEALAELAAGGKPARRR